MRTTVRLSDELMAQARQHALDTDRTLTDLFRDAVVALIQRERGAESPRRLRLPVFHGDGLREGVDIDNAAALLGVMEGSEQPAPGTS